MKMFEHEFIIGFTWGLATSLIILTFFKLKEIGKLLDDIDDILDRTISKLNQKEGE